LNKKIFGLLILCINIFALKMIIYTLFVMFRMKTSYNYCSLNLWNNV